MRDLFLLIIILFTVKIGFSQTEKVLFTVNKTDVSLNEFLRVYNKNSALIKTDNKQKIEEYLKLFIDYKIKVAEAYALGLNNNKLYIKDVADYKKQLSKKYLAIRVVNDQLINEAYDRSLNEVKVNHILVKIKENASSKDSLRAYKLIVSYRKRALKYGFENTMNTVNDGTIVFGESLGYISSFKTVYPFENVAFNTSVNEISKPFRTSFGFHILNVLDKRKSQGNVKVSHILISKNNNKLTNSAKSRSNEIWKKISKGISFSDLAKQFSDDESSANNGGMLASFKKGDLNDDVFEKNAFLLSRIGQVSKPFQTNYGWEIIKLLEKNKLQKLSNQKGVLVQKIKSDSRSISTKKIFYDSLKSRYNFQEIVGLEKEVSKKVSHFFRNEKWNTLINSSEQIVATFADQKTTFSDYHNFLVSNQKKYKKIQSINKLVTISYNDFINSILYTYHKEQIEKIYPEFANSLQEYKEGMLLFELMQKYVWQQGAKDSLGLKKFYEINKTDYFTDTTFKAVVVTCESKFIAKNVVKQLNKDASLIALKKLNKNLIISKGIYELDDNEIPKKYKFNIGVSKVLKHNNQYVVVKCLEVYSSLQKSFIEAKANTINDYQAKFENDWMAELRVKHKVVINSSVLETIY